MAGFKYKATYKTVPSVTKSVNALHDAAAAKDIWTPATGKRFILMGYSLTCHVGVTLVNAAAGDRVILYDEVVTAPVAMIGLCLVATPLTGSVLSSGVQSTATPGAFAPAVATGAQGGDLLKPVRESGLWYRSTAVNNDLKAALVVAATGAVVDVVTGELRIIGTVWGHEEA